MNATPLSPPPPSTTDQRVDAALSTLLVVQALTLFVAIPLGAAHPAFRMLLDAGHLIFAGVCVTVLTRHRLVQGALLAALALLAVGPIAGATASARLGLDAEACTRRSPVPPSRSTRCSPRWSRATSSPPGG